MRVPRKSQFLTFYDSKALDMHHIWTICIKEEAQAKTRKLKKVWTMYNEAKSELADIEAENNREVEAMLESIRDLQKGLQLNQLITHRFD